MKKRFFILFILISILPLISIALFSISSLYHLMKLDEKVLDLELKSSQTFHQRKLNQKFLKSYSDFDPLFVNKYIETLLFKEAESQSLEKIEKYFHNRTLKNRLAFLKSGNKLQFTEENTFSSKGMKEYRLTAVKPVEIEPPDLKKILSLIEGVPIDSFLPLEKRPQLIIKEFNLAYSSEGHFVLNMELIKREFEK